MQTIILAFIISLLAIVGLAVGAIAGRGPIKGSCGSLACDKRLSCGVCKAKTRKDTQ